MVYFITKLCFIRLNTILLEVWSYTQFELLINLFVLGKLYRLLVFNMFEDESRI